MKAFARFMDLERRYGCQNYAPLPVVIERGLGSFLYDVNNRQYFDFLSAYSAVNQGHCHPKILEALNRQSQKLTLTSRAFHSTEFGPFCEFMTQTFGFDRFLPANTGVEAGEAAIKFARKWAYEVKQVEANQATILFARNNFWGRTVSAVSSSTDENARKSYGPYTPGFELVPYNDVPAIRERLEQNPSVCAVFLEPIQGEAGVIVPDPSYLSAVRQLCDEHRVLLILDEVQTGLCRTGQLLAQTPVKADITTLGKALSGGVFPISGVLASAEVMDLVKPGQHGSTFAGSPLACAVARAAVGVLFEENLAQRALELGERFRSVLKAEIGDHPQVKEIRGQGLLNGVEFHGLNAYDICLKLLDAGVLAKQTHETIIRFAPPLTMTDSEFDQALDLICQTLKTYLALAQPNYSRF